MGKGGQVWRENVRDNAFCPDGCVGGWKEVEWDHCIRVASAALGGGGEGRKLKHDATAVHRVWRVQKSPMKKTKKREKKIKEPQQSPPALSLTLSLPPLFFRNSPSAREYCARRNANKGGEGERGERGEENKKGERERERDKAAVSALPHKAVRTKRESGPSHTSDKSARQEEEADRSTIQKEKGGCGGCVLWGRGSRGKK